MCASLRTFYSDVPCLPKMLGRKKHKKPKKPTQGERITDIEEKLNMLMHKLDTALSSGPPARQGRRDLDEAESSGGSPLLAEVSQPSMRDSRPRETASTRDQKTYTPNNRTRARTSTPYKLPRTPRKRSCSPSNKGTRNERFTYSTAEILDSPAAKAKAQQILDILNPSLQEKGKLYDPFYNRQARFAMPRLFVNTSAQKIIRQYKRYDDLTLAQFIEGFSAMIEREKSDHEKRLMLVHLGEIGVMLQDFPWEVVREWSNSILSDIGEGLYNWGDGHKIEKKKVLKMMGAGAGGKLAGSQHRRNACLLFNATKWDESGSHGSNQLHVCSLCLAALNLEHDHPVVACNKRLNFKKGKERGYRFDRDARFDSNQESNPAARQGQDNQYGQNRGRGNYAQYSQYKSQNFPPKFNWNQPPPTDAKNWQQPA